MHFFIFIEMRWHRMLRVTPFEIRKLFEQPMVILFFIASLLLNTIYMVTAGLDQSYINYVQETEAYTGTMITSEFTEILYDQPASKNKQRLLTETTKLENVFQDYSTYDL